MKRLVIGLLLLILAPVYAKADISVWFLDVGQGDSTVVVCDGASLIVDGGSPGASQLVHTFLLDDLGLDHLDYMISTHPHEDHFGGLIAALQALPVECVLTPVLDWKSQRFKKFMEYIDYRESRIIVPDEGYKFNLGEAVVTVLHCWPEAAQWPAKNVDPINDMSICVRIDYGEISFIITGDAESASEYMMIESGLPLKADILRIAHHGSQFSSTEEFLDAVSPQYAVISCGKNNEYNHPSIVVLDLLKARDIILFRTDLQGTVHCVSDGTEIQFITEKEALQETLFNTTNDVPDNPNEIGQE